MILEGDLVPTLRSEFEPLAEEEDFLVVIARVAGILARIRYHGQYQWNYQEESVKESLEELQSEVEAFFTRLIDELAQVVIVTVENSMKTVAVELSEEQAKVDAHAGSEFRLNRLKQQDRALKALLERQDLLSVLFTTLVHASSGLTHLWTRLRDFRKALLAELGDEPVIKRLARHFFVVLDTIGFGVYLGSGRDAYLRIGGIVAEYQVVEVEEDLEAWEAETEEASYYPEDDLEPGTPAEEQLEDPPEDPPA